MSEIVRISDQLQRAFEGRAWHGPALMELLADLSAEGAAAWPLPQAHSIWEIVLHVTAWKDAVRRRLAGEPVELAKDQDWPPVDDADLTAWNRALDALRERHESLAGVVSALSDDDLARVAAPSNDQTFYILLHGIIQHDLYHAGQIALLRRAAGL